MKRKLKNRVTTCASSLITLSLITDPFLFFFPDTSLCDHLRLLVTKPLFKIRGPLIRSVSHSLGMSSFTQKVTPQSSHVHHSAAKPRNFTDSLRCVCKGLPFIFYIAVVPKDNYDNVLEEHFQRSLGVHYQKAQSRQLSISVSVDDHFAKALGDKWLQIKSKSSSCSSTPPSSPSVTHSPTYSHSPNLCRKESTSSSVLTPSHWSVN